MFTELKKKDILEFSRDEIVSWLAYREIAAYRADQIQKWIYLRQADGFDVMTDLSKDIRSALSQQFSIGRLDVERLPLEYLELVTSHDVAALLMPPEQSRLLQLHPERALGRQ